jgi:quinol monooxygenase YgiN
MSDTTSPTATATATATTSVGASFLQVIAHYHVKPGLGDQVGALLVELTEATRREAKNLAYAFYRSPQDPDRYVILEQYTDASGLDEHRASEHFQRLGFGTIIPMLVSREVTSYVVRTGADGKPADAVKT